MKLSMPNFFCQRFVYRFACPSKRLKGDGDSNNLEGKITTISTFQDSYSKLKLILKIQISGNKKKINTKAKVYIHYFMFGSSFNIIYLFVNTVNFNLGKMLT